MVNLSSIMHSKQDRLAIPDFSVIRIRQSFCIHKIILCIHKIILIISANVNNLFYQPVITGHLRITKPSS